VKPLLHARADAVDLLQLEAERNVGQLVIGDDDKAIRLLQIGTDLAEKDVRREADRAGEAVSDLLPQGALDLQGELDVITLKLPGAAGEGKQEGGGRLSEWVFWLRFALTRPNSCTSLGFIP
jgi:hypothetical protein